jgi:NADPH2:quinone reductase
MKAIRVEAHGGPDVLKLDEVAPIDKPGPGQAVVRVVAAGVNFMDVGQRRGSYPRELPFIPGVEGAGVVESVGNGVNSVKPSDRVAFTGAPGAYAEAVVVDADRLIPLPDDFSFEQGAAFPLQGMTAHYLIHEYRKPRPGEFVLIHAAAGGVGGLLVQWAHHLGATVLGTTSTEEKARTAREAGADHVVVVHSDEDFAAETKRLTKGHGVDLILDSVGQSTFKGDLESVAVRGHIVIFGSASGPADPISPNALMARAVSLSGGSLQNFLRTHEELMRRANDVIEGIHQGWLKLKIETLPLAQASKAHQLLEGRKTQGKLVLSVADSRQAASA